MQSSALVLSGGTVPAAPTVSWTGAGASKCMLLPPRDAHRSRAPRSAAHHLRTYGLGSGPALTTIPSSVALIAAFAAGVACGAGTGRLGPAGAAAGSWPEPRVLPAAARPCRGVQAGSPSAASSLRSRIGSNGLIAAAACSAVPGAAGCRSLGARRCAVVAAAAAAAGAGGGADTGGAGGGAGGGDGGSRVPQKQQQQHSARTRDSGKQPASAGTDTAGTSGSTAADAAAKPVPVSTTPAGAPAAQPVSSTSNAGEQAASQQAPPSQAQEPQQRSQQQSHQQQQQQPVQSEYVEEYETVFVTESEVPEAEAAGKAGKEAAAAAGVGSSEAVAAAAGGASGWAGAAGSQKLLQQAGPGPAPMLASSTAAAVGGSLAGTSVGGWALAAALLLAVRLGREAADEERTDLFALQARQAEGRQLDADLRARRRQFLEAEKRRAAEEAEKRVAEAKARAEADAKAAEERKRLEEEEAAREAQRMAEAAEAARRVYEEREARLDAELMARAEVERRLREEAEARRRAEEEAKRRAEAEAAAREAERRAAEAAAEAARRAAEAAARKETERRLRLASTWYALSFKGSVTGKPAPAGTTVPPPPGAAGAAADLLRGGPAAARLVLDCSVQLSTAARTAPTLDLGTVAAAAAAIGGGAAVATEESKVVAAESEAAAAAATVRLEAAALPPPPAVSLEAAESATAVVVTAVSGSSSRPYESAAAAVEGAVDLAGNACEPVALLLTGGTGNGGGGGGWLGQLPLQPPPVEALRAVLEAEVAAAASIEAAAAAHGQLPSVESLVEAELRHWGRMAQLQVLAAGRQVCVQLAPLLGPSESLEQAFECRIVRQVPPPRSELPPAAAAMAACVSPALARAAAAAAAANAANASSAASAGSSGGGGGLQVAVGLIDGAIAREEAAAAAGGRDGAANGAALPPLAVAALVYAEAMEAAGYVPPPPAAAAPSGDAEAGPTSASSSPTSTLTTGSGSEADGEESATELAAARPPAAAAAAAAAGVAALERLMRYQLGERARGAPADSLTATAQLLRRMLPGGGRHAVCRAMDRLAESNMSIGARQALQIRRQRAALEAQAAAALAQQPGGSVAARGGSLVPVPERLWASRNVANNLLRFGEPLQVGEALRMLEEAVSLARRHYGERHPAQLSVLLDYVDALGTAAAVANAAAAAGAGAGAAGGAAAGGGAAGGDGDGLLGDAAAVAAARAKAATELLEVVQGICERYQASRDLLSTVLLLEAAAGEVAPALKPPAAPRGSAGARTAAAAADLAAELIYSLKPPEARTVMTARRDGELPKLLRRLGREASEELGAYASGKRNRWLDAWNRGSGALPPLRP